MDNVTFSTITHFDGTTTEMALIAHNDGSFTSMSKATYDAQLASQTDQ